MNAKPKILVVIPARYGSVRLPNKNLRRLRGQTLVGRTLCKALRFEEHCRDVLDMVVTVSSDHAAICAACAEDAEDFGGPERWRFIERPPELATSEADGMVTPLHALEAVKDRGPFDGLLLLQPTSPLLSFETLALACERWMATPAISVIGACCAGVPNGAFYLVHARRFAEARSWGFHNAWWFIMSPDEGLDVDCEFDLEQARAYLSKRETPQHRMGFGL